MVTERARDQNCCNVLTFRKITDHGAVHGQTKGVARLGGQLFGILRPLPAVPVRAEEKLVVDDAANLAEDKGTRKGATHRNSRLHTTVCDGGLLPARRSAGTHALAGLTSHDFPAAARVSPPRFPRSRTRSCPPACRPCIQKSGHLELLPTRPRMTRTPAEQNSARRASWAVA